MPSTGGLGPLSSYCTDREDEGRNVRSASCDKVMGLGRVVLWTEYLCFHIHMLKP